METGALATILVSLITAVLGSSLITAILQRRWSKKDKDDNVRVAVRLSLLFLLQIFGKEIINKGYCSALEYNQFIDAYLTYKKLEGDGYADVLKEQIEEVNKQTIQGGVVS